MKNYSAVKIRENFADIINQVRYGKEYIAVNRHGKPVAIIVPPEVIELLEHLIDQLDIKEAIKIKKEMKQKGSISWEKLKKEMDLKE